MQVDLERIRELAGGGESVARREPAGEDVGANGRRHLVEERPSAVGVYADQHPASSLLLVLHKL